MNELSIDCRISGLEASSLDYDRIVYGLQEAIQIGRKKPQHLCAEKYKCKLFS